MSQVKQHVEEMVTTIFRNRREIEQSEIGKKVAAIRADHASRGVLNSGMTIRKVLRTHESGVIQAIEGTLEELALQFRQAGRRDATLFWNIVEPRILDLADSFGTSTFKTAMSSLPSTDVALVTRESQRFLSSIKPFITSRIHELRLKSQFITLKTPEDRRANNIPDVAVMMWFPNLETDKPEDVEASRMRFEAIKAAVYEASGGLATVNKFDDPEVIPQDRISASIEMWLEKAVVVICDLGGQRPNVYYEFGYARAISTDVILTCPKEEATSTKLHLGHWQRIEYNDTTELQSKLIEKLKVLLPKYDLSGTL